MAQSVGVSSLTRTNSLAACPTIWSGKSCHCWDSRVYLDSVTRRGNFATMSGWTGQSAYKQLAGILAASEEDEFERKVLPLLRLFWPTLQQAPRKRVWDQRGIDLLVWVDQPPFPCVVQCKGFKVQELDADQMRQAVDSIHKFRDSGVTADTYLFVHNREGRNREFAEKTELHLRELVALGRVRCAELWIDKCS